MENGAKVCQIYISSRRIEFKWIGKRASSTSNKQTDEQQEKWRRVKKKEEEEKKGRGGTNWTVLEWTLFIPHLPLLTRHDVKGSRSLREAWFPFFGRPCAIVHPHLHTYVHTYECCWKFKGARLGFVISSTDLAFFHFGHPFEPLHRVPVCFEGETLESKISSTSFHRLGIVQDAEAWK